MGLSSYHDNNDTRIIARSMIDDERTSGTTESQIDSEHG